MDGKHITEVNYGGHGAKPHGFFLGLIAALWMLPLAMSIVSPAHAEGDDWANAVIAEAKAAERAVNGNNERVRVASLGGGVYAPSRERASRARTSEKSVEADRPQVTSKPKRVASLGNRSSDADDKPARKNLSGGNVSWTASASCLDSTLRNIVVSLSSNYGPVTVNSTCRDAGHNRRVGGAPRSKHLSGDAVDFRIHSNASAAYASLRNNGNVGGLKHYGGGLFHIDNGPRRGW
jgi:hypothetical protein